MSEVCVLFEAVPPLPALPTGVTAAVVDAQWTGEALERAVLHRWQWQGAPEAVLRHRAFVRVHATAPDEPLDDLWLLTDAALALLAVPGALACFFPAGEALRSPQFVADSAAHHRAHGLPAFDTWTNLRLFQPDGAPGWTAFDLVGLQQLGLDDLEICFEGPYEPPDRFLYSTALYLLQHGQVIRTGHTIDGPGGRWRASRHLHPLAPPPRPTLRFLRAGALAPPALLEKPPQN